MASTSACYKLFREKQKEGHGEAIMFKGECSRGPGSEPGPQGGLWEDGAGERFDPNTQLHFRSSARSEAMGSPWREAALASALWSGPPQAAHCPL